MYNPAFKADVVVTQRFSSSHLGFDSSSAWGAKPGHPIYTMERGTVVETNLVYGTYGWVNTSGSYIAVKHPGSATHYFVTTYKHLSSRNTFVGESLVKGARVGAEGSTGVSTGTHLHQDVFEYKDGKLNRVDPEPFINDPTKLIVEEDAVYIPVIANYVTTDNIKIREGAGLSFKQTGLLDKGSSISVTHIKDVDGYSWGEIGDNKWSALGTADGKTLWVQAVVHVDQTAEIAALKAKVSDLNATVKTLSTKITNAQRALG